MHDAYFESSNTASTDELNYQNTINPRDAFHAMLVRKATKT